MEKVESFELDHRIVKAPYIRKCCLLTGRKGDNVTKFDIDFYSLIWKPLEQLQYTFRTFLAHELKK